MDEKTRERLKAFMNTDKQYAAAISFYIAALVILIYTGLENVFQFNDLGKLFFLGLYAVTPLFTAVFVQGIKQLEPAPVLFVASLSGIGYNFGLHALIADFILHLGFGVTSALISLTVVYLSTYFAYAPITRHNKGGNQK